MNSTELKKQAELEENDLKAMALYKKALREENLEHFEDYKDRFSKLGYYLTEYKSQGKVTIEPTRYGIIDYYPKADKALIRETSRWVTPGLAWLRINLLME